MRLVRAKPGVSYPVCNPRAIHKQPGLHEHESRSSEEVSLGEHSRAGMSGHQHQHHVPCVHVQVPYGVLPIVCAFNALISKFLQRTSILSSPTYQHGVSDFDEGRHHPDLVRHLGAAQHHAQGPAVQGHHKPVYSHVRRGSRAAPCCALRRPLGRRHWCTRTAGRTALGCSQVTLRVLGDPLREHSHGGAGLAHPQHDTCNTRFAPYTSVRCRCLTGGTGLEAPYTVVPCGLVQDVLRHGLELQAQQRPGQAQRYEARDALRTTPHGTAGYGEAR